MGGAIAGACIGSTGVVVAYGAAGGEAAYLIQSGISGQSVTATGAIVSAGVGAAGNGIAAAAGRAGGGVSYFSRPFPGNALSNTAGAIGSATANAFSTSDEDALELNWVLAGHNVYC